MTLEQDDDRILGDCTNNRDTTETRWPQAFSFTPLHKRTCNSQEGYLLLA